MWSNSPWHRQFWCLALLLCTVIWTAADGSFNRYSFPLSLIYNVLINSCCPMHLIDVSCSQRISKTWSSVTLLGLVQRTLHYWSYFKVLSKLQTDAHSRFFPFSHRPPNAKTDPSGAEWPITRGAGGAEKVKTKVTDTDCSKPYK